jgi:cytochrome c oxidase subunit II
MKPHRPVVSSLLVTCVLALLFATTTGASAHPTVDIVASNWKFTPAQISIPVGEPTTIRVTSTSGVHGLESDALGIAKTTITPGTFQLITFTPKTAGTYVLHCAVICGPGHADMTLTVVVTP